MIRVRALSDRHALLARGHRAWLGSSTFLVLLVIALTASCERLPAPDGIVRVFNRTEAATSLTWTSTTSGARGTIEVGSCGRADEVFAKGSWRIVVGGDREGDAVTFEVPGNGQVYVAVEVIDDDVKLLYDVGGAAPEPDVVAGCDF